MRAGVLFGVAFVANLLVLVICTGETTQASATSASSASETSSKSSSYASSSSSAKSGVRSKPAECRKVKKCPKNEEFSYCPQSLQRAQYCSEKAEPCTSRISSDKPCKEGCVCKNNYLRAENGTCIPAEQCPLTCAENEVLDNCPNSCDSDYCPATEEDTYIKPCVFQDVCPPPACTCTFNHRRAANGSCIPTRECPPFDCTGRPNEVYNPCPPLCPTDDCSQASPSGQCPQFGRIGIILPCNPKCRCIEGYWRLDGICVPYGQCPGVCPDNERYSTCIQAECRALNCTQKDQSVPCIRLDPQFCKKGCVCQEGYLRNQDGICVLEDKCEPGVCPDNERYSTCIQAECRALNCTQKNQSVPCIRLDPRFCKKGCVCQEGYLRNQEGVCVLEDKCEPGVCPDNERYSTCIQAECVALNCTQKNQSVPCVEIDPQFCMKGCICQKGYLRNQDGICVLEDKCEPTCPANEELVPCMQGVCRAKNCSEKGQDVPCPDIPTEECDSGCICKEGFLRAEDGSCVPENQCEPGVCPDNERYSTCIQAECRALNCTQKDQSVPCIRLDPQFCKKGCVCHEGYLRNQDGICVLEENCESCGENEVLENCSNTCNTDNCPLSADEEQVCTQSDPCMPACKCRFNYKRTENGTCIPTRDCPPFDCSAKPNEEFVACPPYCPTDACGKPRLDGYCPFRIGIVLICQPKCQCKDGFGRDNGTCVPFEECPDLCPANEVYSPCVQQTCRPQNCSDRDLKLETCPTSDAAECQRGCVCQENYYRNDSGDCVSYEECGAGVCPDNERYSTCIQAECRALNCTQKDQSVPCIRLDPQFCKKGCVCQEGYLRNQDGICVLEENCEPHVCPANEEWSTCAQATCRAQNCTQRGKPIACPMILDGYCEEACVCKENYLRNKDGDCIPEDQCPCGENEVLENCSMTCNTDNCPLSADEEQVCTQTDPCMPACKCRFNYKRNENGTCIPTRDCPPFDCSAKPNEEFVACPPYCPTDACGKPRLDGFCPFRIGVVLICQPKCQCKDGYGRDNGTCVPFEECPDLCPANEVYSPCVQQTCPQNCSDRDLKLETCPTSDGAECQRGCVCQENYYRNDKGDCVSYEECGAGVCPDNERYSTCIQAECRALNCTQKDQSVPCIRLDPQFCKKGCVCQEGYLRNQDGICVLEENCEPYVCPANEEWSTCAQATCRAQNCTQRGKPIACPMILDGYCEEACVCKENYLRNKDGDCIPEDQCPCGENEVLENCSMTCNTDNCPLSADEEQVCTQSDPCIPACKCRFNYKRAENGTCIPTRDCPPFDCSAKPNEEFVACPPYCPTDACGKPRLNGYCPFKIGVVLKCQPKCQCKDGYGRDNGTCVPFEECPDLCPANEVYSPCVQQTCRPQNCSDRDLKLETCPTSDEDECQRGCVCQENYYRNDKGDCVSYEECGGPICPNAHEVYEPNLKECPPNTCGALVARIPCDENQKVGPGCRCQDGYLRLNETELCVPICDCPEMKYSADCLK